MSIDDSDGVASLLEDIRLLVDDGNRIVARGKEIFFDPVDRTQRMAAKAIVIDVQSAAERLPKEFRDMHPAVPWNEIRAMRNYLAHDYLSTDYLILWNALETDFPRIDSLLGQ